VGRIDPDARAISPPGGQIGHDPVAAPLRAPRKERFLSPRRLTAFQIVVLLIDDQPIVGEAVRRMLGSEPDIVYHFCGDPTLAVGKAEELNPTVILQDLVMPRVDGMTLVRQFRQNAKTRDVPLIVLSTKEDAKVKAEAFALGANDYLVKRSPGPMAA
jgi:sigma-B regulation protein RsbU (phosphoserine phosphatase)